MAPTKTAKEPSTAIATQPDNAVATQVKPAVNTLRKWLESDEFKSEVSKAVPKHLGADRFLRVAINATMRNPKLLQCTQTSLLKCLLDLAAFGLEADGRRAHLIPFDNSKKVGNEWVKETECTLILDWKGVAELVMRSGLVSYLHADVIRQGDLFVYNKGQLETHVPWFLRKDAGKPKEAGSRFAAYSLVKMKDGTEKCEVIAMEDIIAIRNKSQGWIAFQKGWAKQSPWNPADEHIESEMWKKTAFKRLSKWVPWSPEIRNAVEYGDDAIDIGPGEYSTLQVTQIPGESRSDQLTALLSKRLEEDVDQQDHPQEREPGDESGPAKTGPVSLKAQIAARINVATSNEQLTEIESQIGQVEPPEDREGLFFALSERHKQLAELAPKGAKGQLPLG